MEIGAYEIALIGVGGTIVGALIGAWIAHRFSLKLFELTIRREANRRFISVFHQELSDIYPTPVNWPNDIHGFLSCKFPALQAAVGEFRHYLPVDKWEAFDNAWFSYYCSTDREIDKTCQVYHHYTDCETLDGNIAQIQDGRKNLKSNVDKILRFAK